MPFKIDLWRDGVIEVAKSGGNPDSALKSRINRNAFGIDGFPMPRKRNGTGGESPFRADKSFNKTTDGAKSALKNIFGTSTSAGAPCDRCWNEAADSGSYTFLNTVYAESEFLQTDESSYNVITVEDNTITQIAELELNSSDEFNLKSLTSFDVEKGEVKSRTEKGWFGREKTVNYRELTVTETTQNFKDNKADGDATSKTYKREEIIK